MRTRVDPGAAARLNGFMAREIERKFLVVSPAWRGQDEGVSIRQGYLSADPARTVRVRLAGGAGFLTIKGLAEGIVRPEFEYPIPPSDARALLDLCAHPVVEKTRHEVLHVGKMWQVDEFHGANRGLVLAEIELESADEAVELPSWIGTEVTGDSRYQNSSLSVRPFASWGDAH